jgi:hypothetical protein
MAEVVEAESAETTYNDVENIADIFDSVVKLRAQNEEARRAQIEALRVFDIAANMYSVLINRIQLQIDILDAQRIKSTDIVEKSHLQNGIDRYRDLLDKVGDEEDPECYINI